MKNHLFNRLLSLVLAAAVVLGLFPVVDASSAELRWEKSDVDVSWHGSDRLIPEELHGTTAHKPTDKVRVSIILEDKPTLMAGYSTNAIASNQDARAYDRKLQKAQEHLAGRISAQALGGKPLDVVWNLTLAGNIIAANLPYGKIDAVKGIDGVLDVVIENGYELLNTDPISTNMHSAAGMVGAAAVWQTGLTGAGSRIAIVDTGTDTDHQSFDNGAYLYALEKNAEEKGMTLDAYTKSLDLLDSAEIGTVLKHLNAYERIRGTAASFYINEKLPFGANYVDYNLTVDHDYDNKGSHGSHVGGIAAANRYIPEGESYADALQRVRMCGVAPDAQIITLKVFGNGSGPFESDYFAAIEDAIWLGCDSVNLSLGSGSPGSSHNSTFAELLKFLETTDTVVVMSSGNSGYWAENTKTGYLYSDGVSFQTNGEPGSYTNAMTVASADNTGTLTVSGNRNGSGKGADGCRMSAFSSWGIPGSLKLKPEITAPGGEILSINGLDPSGTSYEVQSGTSMATPQVSGMAALVAAHIRNAGLEDRTGLSIRQLAQSLLMSTAVPVKEEKSVGPYYSILNQGAGLARVDLAVSAESYVTVEGQTDGKVKVELGDDAEREGVYDFSFTIHNFNGQNMCYELSSDMFTQRVFDGDDGNSYLDTRTVPLRAKAVFFSNGMTLENMSSDIRHDLNGDGITTGADADFLLEYLLGNEPALMADGDVSGDGEINTYDAHVLLNSLSGCYSVNVPADGSVTVDARLILTEDTKENLDSNYPTGAYIEAYVFAKPCSDIEGNAGVVHSIPVLGYYGSWTEPSMYDVGGYAESYAGLQTRDAYLSDVHGNQCNYLSVDYGDGKGYLFGGNPIVREDTYLPERNAISSKSGAMLQYLNVTLIRKAAASRIVLEDADTGDEYLSMDMGPLNSAYYNMVAGTWQNAYHRMPVYMDLKGFDEGTRMNFSLIAAPEYYCTYDAEGRVTTDWDALDDGAYLTVPFTIDNTAPAIKDVRPGQNSTLKITARDNEYIAAVALMDRSGKEMLASAPANQTVRGKEMTCTLDLSNVFTDEFLVAVYDYAQNKSVYEVTLRPENDRPRFTAIDRGGQNSDSSAGYVGLRADGTSARLNDIKDRALPQAVAYAEGAVFEITDDHMLYVGFDDQLSGLQLLADLDPEGEWEIGEFADLAYNRLDGKIYGLFYSEKSDQHLPYLCTIDLYTGDMRVLGRMPIDVNSLAIDGNGKFYSVGYGDCCLYTYTSDVIARGETVCIGMLGDYRNTGRNYLAWDHHTGELFWLQPKDDGEAALVKVDPGTAATEIVNSYKITIGGLYIAYEPEIVLFSPSENVTAVTMQDSAETMTGNSLQLKALVRPWNVSDSSVNWTTSDDDVASVDAHGVVMGKRAGTAVITATSCLDKSKYACCTVTVFGLEGNLKAVFRDNDGAIRWSEIALSDISGYRHLAETDLPVNSTMMADGKLYASTLDIHNERSDLYTVDPVTFEMTKVGGSESIAYMDMAYAPSLGFGMGVYLGYVVMIDLQTGEYERAWEWNKGITRPLVGITYCGSSYNSAYGTSQDTFLLLDADGNVYEDSWVHVDGEWMHLRDPGEAYVTNIGDSVDSNYFQGFHYDGAYVYWTRYHEADKVVELRVWDRDGTGNVYSMGYFPEQIRNVAGIYTDDRLGDRDVRPNGEAPADSAAVLMSKAEFTDEIAAQVILTMPEEGTNGRLQLNFEPNNLEFLGICGMTSAFAWKQISPGEIALAFAEGAVLDEGAVVASVNFAVHSTDESTASIRYTEFGEEKSALVEEITIKGARQNPFVDVARGAFYYDPVLWAVDLEITKGVDDTHFDPNGVCMRGNVVTFLWRAMGCPEPRTTVNPFMDVRPSDYFYKAVLWAYENGITIGTDDTHFAPTGECNRAQVVTFLWRTMGTPAPSEVSVRFTDVMASQFYSDAVAWAVENGITSGMGDGTFGVLRTCSRAQVVTFLYRTLA